MSNYKPKYATITMVEINHLMSRNAPKNALPILLVLNAYAQDGHSCFPSIRTIGRLLNNALSVRSIQKAIKWLVENLVIERNARTSKKRFVNLLRKMVYGIEGEVSERFGRSETNDLDPIREPPEKNISPLYISPEKGKVNKRTHHLPNLEGKIKSRLNSAKRRVQRYTNILNNRESSDGGCKRTDEIRASITCWIACSQFGQPNFDGSQKELEDIRKLYHSDESVRCMVDEHPIIRGQIVC
jgi:hypothetical protein